MYKKILSILICCFIVANISACQISSNKAKIEDPITIKYSWWGGEDRYDKTMKAIEKFQQAHPNIKVKVEFSEWKGFKKKMNMKIAGNDEPDLMQINYDWLETYSKDGTGFYDLNKVSDTLDLNNFSSDILNYGTKNGVLNAIPISMNAKVMYYNKTLATQFGVDNYKTFDELLANRKNVTSNDKYLLEYDETNAWILPMSYIQQKTGHNFIDSSGKLEFNETDIKDLLTFYKSLVDNKIVPQSIHKSVNDLSGNISLSNVSWISEASKIQKSLEKSNNKVGYSELPSIDGQNFIRYVKPSMLYAISKNTEHPKEAALLMNFLLNDSDTATTFELDKGIPCSKNAFNVLQENNKLSGLQYESSKKSDNVKEILISPYYENTLIQNIFVEALDQISYGKSTPEQCANDTYYKLVQTLDSLTRKG